MSNRFIVENSKQLNRDQLKKCFIDLAQRAGELNEPYIQSICLVLAGSIVEESDNLLAMWVSQYAQLRIDDITEDYLKDENEGTI